ncbi:sulfotransferase family 2 domain-containing protein [uncultured Psychroserpens sp.]|uniref:sulfotransferase family 2 domain-containing protein n=1 Tax=uncultured Psychroserpens sp. TaxID=255436 RepID=UPI00261F0DA7|nr:sulfotransferase family 2 domain-containing protein [uncultured Psychroserpens sp.]
MKHILKKIIPSPFKERLQEYNRRRFCSKLYLNKERPNPGPYYSLNVFDYYRCIFIHIPKAAGISFNMSLFGNYGGGHRDLKFYEEKYPKRTFNDYYKFTIVRNPWDRLYSAYTFLKKGGFDAIDKAWADEHLNQFNSFEDFVLNWVTKANVYKKIHFMPQYEFLIDVSGELNMDYIGRFETIETSYKDIAAYLGIDTVLEKRNITKNKKQYFEQYTEKMITIVSDVYQRDIEEFGYTFRL